MTFVLGIDSSTTATKAIIAEEDGAVRGVASASYDYEIPRPQWTEQDPRLWWDGAITAVRQVLADTGVAGSEIDAVGLTGQMHGSVLLDSGDEVVRPAILWNDQRTAEECREIEERIGELRRSGILARRGNQDEAEAHGRPAAQGGVEAHRAELPR